MSKFNPSPKTLVVSELIDKGFEPDLDDALKLCHNLEEEELARHKVSIGLTAAGIVSAGITLAFCGAVTPLLVPIAAIGVGMAGVWNHPIRANRRDDEADFLRANKSIIPLITSKLQSGEANFKVSSAYQECFRSWRNTGQPLSLPQSEPNVTQPEQNQPNVTQSVPIWDRLTQPEQNQPNVPQPNPTCPSFDWNDLDGKYDDYPHLLLLGKTGAGKTFLSESLGKFLDGSTIVITPKKKPRDFQGLKVVGIPYDFEAIAEEISKVAQMVKDREAEMNRTGNEDFETLNVILDEVPTFVAGCKDDGFDVVKDLKFIIRTARTSKIRLILLAQGSEVKTLGIEGEGSLRDNLTFIRLKGFAEPCARNLGIDLSAYQRPCLINEVVADLSVLVSLADATKKEPSDFHFSPVDQLNNSFNLESVTPAHESERVTEQNSTDIFTTFADTLNHESQATLKSFVLWLGKKSGSEVSFKQMQDSWAKNNNVARGKETLMPLIYAAKSRKILTLLSNNNWLVCGR